MCVQLPNASGCSVNPRRFTASRRANLGNVIRQSSAFHVSAADVAYKGIISASNATEVSAIHEAGSSVYLTVRGRVFLASMDLENLEPTDTPGRWSMSARFGIVSEVEF